MKTLNHFLPSVLVLSSVLFISSCEMDSMTKLTNDLEANSSVASDQIDLGARKNESSVTNNLSFPVIWAEGTSKALRIPPTGLTETDLKLEGEWWYVWGEDPLDPDYPIFSCLQVEGEEPCYPEGVEVYKAWVQKDENNYWQATAANAIGMTNVDVIDWGDNLESVDWYLTSKVRTEVVLYENNEGPALRQYSMRHVSGWGSDELHGLQSSLENVPVLGLGDQATVYSEHARFTIQKITSDTPELTWDSENSIWTGDVLEPIFSGAVWEAEDGPGFYNAEINIKGKIIFGYTWDVKRANNGVGVYRLTFSFDEGNNADLPTTLNTFFTESTILEGAEISTEEEGEGGATAVIDPVNNLTYIDVTILGNKGGGKGGKPTGGGNGGNGGNGPNGG
jgi:hypothetical protein